MQQKSPLTYIMKKTFFNSLLKRLSLFTLATGTLCATTVALSSCGGGGGGSSMSGLRMELYSGGSCQYITLQEPITKGSKTYRGYSAWGEESNGVSCMVTFDKVDMDGSGEISSLDFRMSFNPGYEVTETDGFKAWWGIGLSFDGISMRGMPQYQVTCTPGSGTHGVREGKFTVVDDETFDFEVTWPNGGSGSMRNDGTENPTGWVPPHDGIAIISHS